MNGIKNFFQWLLYIFLFYLSFVSIYISFFKNSKCDFLTIFFVVTLLLFTFFSLKKISTQDLTFNLRKEFKIKKKLLYILFLCFISLFFGFINVIAQYPRGITDAEIGQFFVSILPSKLQYFSENTYEYKKFFLGFAKNSIEAAYKQQQPPIDYYFSSFSHFLFGENKFSIRFHAILFYLILTFIIPLGIYFFCPSFRITVIGTVLFLINDIIRLHSVNARPVCLALFTGFLFLFFYMSLCKENSYNKKQFLPLIISQYLFVMSIGLQPVVFIVSLFVASFQLFFSNKKHVFKKLFISNIITGVLVSPFYVNMWIFGRASYKFKQISLESIASYMENINIWRFFGRYFFPFYDKMFLFFIVVIIGLIIIGIYKKFKDKLILILLPSIILFPFLYDFLFNIGVFWDTLHNWYYITFSLFLILFIVLSLNEICNCFKSEKWNTSLFSFILIIFLWKCYSQIAQYQKYIQFHFPYRDNSVKQVYDHLEEKGNTNDIAIEFSLTPVLVTRSNDITFGKIVYNDPKQHPIVMNFYIEFTKIAPFFWETGHDKIYYIDWNSMSQNKNQKIFFISSPRNDHHDDKAYEVLSSFMTGKKVGKYVVYEVIFSSGNKMKEYIKFLLKINKKTPKKYRSAIYETLIYYAYRNNKKTEFDQLLQEYRELY